MVLNMVLKKAMSFNRGILWGQTASLEDVNYVDDLCLFLQSFQDKSAKEFINRAAKPTGSNGKKTKKLWVNSTFAKNLLLEGEDVKQILIFLLSQQVHHTKWWSHIQLCGTLSVELSRVQYIVAEAPS